MKIVFADLLPGETPIDDITGLKVSGISTKEGTQLLRGGEYQEAYGQVLPRRGDFKRGRQI